MTCRSLRALRFTEPGKEIKGPRQCTTGHSGRLFGIRTLLMDISGTALHCWRVTWPLQHKANAIWVTPGGAYPQALDWH